MEWQVWCEGKLSSICHPDGYHRDRSHTAVCWAKSDLSFGEEFKWLKIKFCSVSLLPSAGWSRDTHLMKKVHHAQCDLYKNMFLEQHPPIATLCKRMFDNKSYKGCWSWYMFTLGGISFFTILKCCMCWLMQIKVYFYELTTDQYLVYPQYPLFSLPDNIYLKGSTCVWFRTKIC